MTIKLQFLLEKNQRKDCIPDKIRLTKSLNQETGTISLSFGQLFPLETLLNDNKPIVGLYIIGSDFFFFTKEIRCVWKKGKPLLVQAIFLIDKKEELLLLLKVFKNYAKAHGLKNFNLE